MILSKPRRKARIDKGLIEAMAKGETPAKARSKKTVENSCESLAIRHCNEFYRHRCQAEGYTGFDCPPIRCSDKKERAHLKSRSEDYIQFRPDNVTLLCNVHHRYFTRHPDVWTAFVNSKYPGRWELLNGILNDRRDTKVKTPLIVVYTACESWYKLGAKIEDWPWEPLCPEFIREAA